ncbi:MAG: rhomboid family intramembrane serine protease [Hyphomicrobiales bacterium]
MPIPIADENPTKKGQKSPVTKILIALNVLVYLFYQVDFTNFLNGMPSYQSLMGFGLIPVVFWGDRPLAAELITIPADFTIITYMFLHGGLMHLVSNMLILWIFGDNIEQALGRYRFLGFYLLGGIVAGLLHALMQADSVVPMIGASGAVSAVGAAYLLLHPRAKLWLLLFWVIPVKIAAWMAILAWIAYQLYESFSIAGDQAVAWWAHIGGFGFGLAYILLLRRDLISPDISNWFKK